MADHIESRSAEPARTGSLLVVGVGITGIGQVTLEAEAAIKAADQVFYLVLERTTELWLRLANPRASTLSNLYAEGKERRQTYAEMTARIVDAVRQGQRVCAVFYGHPAVFVESSHAAVRELVADGYQARILPGISADACLYAELGFNPGAYGVQSFEATDFLRARRIFDPSSNLLLWQVGVLGEIDARVGGRCLPERLHTLVEYLRPHYPHRHEIVLVLRADVCRAQSDRRARGARRPAQNGGISAGIGIRSARRPAAGRPGHRTVGQGAPRGVSPAQQAGQLPYGGGPCSPVARSRSLIRMRLRSLAAFPGNSTTKLSKPRNW